MDAPMKASFFFARLGKCGQVLSSIRPVRAAMKWPLACMEIRRPGPYRLRELHSSPFSYWFSRPRLVDRLPLPVLRPAHIPNDFARAASQAATGAR